MGLEWQNSPLMAIAIDAGSAFGILMDVPPSADGFVSYDETSVADGAATYILSGSVA